jgi:hypothetical protein
VKRVFLDDRLQEEFERQGFTVVRLLSASASRSLLAEIEQVREAYSPGESCTTGIEQSFCTDNAGYRQRIHEVASRIVEEPLIELLDGYRLVAAGVMIKKPLAGEMDIHRDRTILADSDQVTLNVWCPLVDVDESAGTLSVLPGSHRITNVETPGVECFYASYGRKLKRWSDSLRLRAGEAVLFDNGLLHWSTANRGRETRPVVRCTAVPIESRAVFYKLDSESGGTRFELYDVEAEGALAHSPDDVASGAVALARIGYAENRNRPISPRECRELAIKASGPGFLPAAKRRLAFAAKDIRAWVRP